ncbi:MAG TPA: DUF5946 family protein [Patescibacteria group bacterium]|nr:DUF5946 family protein [Patescibacteria group bacterium]
MPSEKERNAYNELSFYTLSHQSPSFIHQLIVDAFAAQCADEQTKPISITFALIGLYLHLEKGFTGKEVQRAHMELAKKKHVWPKIPLPKQRGKITIFSVLQEPDGSKRDAIIECWCESVWEAYKDAHEQIADLLKKSGLKKLSS